MEIHSSMQQPNSSPKELHGLLKLEEGVDCTITNGWDFNMEWEEEDDDEENGDSVVGVFKEEEEEVVLGKCNIGFWDGGEFSTQKRFNLKLNLNYQQVLEAWSDRRPLWTTHHEHYSSQSVADSACHYSSGMEEGRGRRETSVMRYKEKRQNRLFSKKIRYQVRKLNADKRPRLKGRFVRRAS